MVTNTFAKPCATKYYVVCFIRTMINNSGFVQIEVTVEQPLSGRFFELVREMVAERSGIDNPDDVVVLNVIPID